MDAFEQPHVLAATQQAYSTTDRPKAPHLYIGGLSPRVTEYMLQEVFAVAGPVTACKIIPDRNFTHGGANYGFVEFADMRSAETAIQTLNGRKIFDMEIRCNWAYQNQTPKEDLTNHFHVFVGDLSPEVNDEVLQKAFSAFGSLSDARCMWDMNTGKSRGYGFLAFRDKSDAEQAITTMNGEYLGNRAIRVNWANQKNGMHFGAGGPAAGGAGGPAGFAGAAAASPVRSPTSGTPGSYQSIANQTPSFNSTIYVGNLVPYCTQADLIPLFQSYGYIVEIRLQADRGFAFVKLDTHDNAANAIVNLNGVQIHGRPIKCSWGKDRMDGAGIPAGSGGATPQHHQYMYAAQAYSQPYAAYGAQAAAVGHQSPYGAATSTGVAANGQQGAATDPAAQAAALAQWQATYGAQYAAYMQQQAALQQHQQQQHR
ncbi:E3 ubiquitin-protein ligase pub1 [Microbotryomycetes sp. JL221]|nr:E3 ubiquitin-protein ligase pub1 [Microbotryomycetes sp. JL221]